MLAGRWIVELSESVKDFLEEQEKVVRHAIERDLEKLEVRGTQAKFPLVRHFEEGVLELRIKRFPHGIYRAFYFQNGPHSFLAFHACRKQGRRLGKRERRRIMCLYHALERDEKGE